MTAPKLYAELAHWWPIFSAKEDYADEAATFRDILKTAVAPSPKTVAEHDVHACGLFARDVWLRLLQEAGFNTRIVIDSYNRDLFVALKPAV